jgi:sugar lactone lactonase YvrE
MRVMIGVSVLLGACASTPTAPPVPPRVWPEPPEVARIAHVQSLATPEDLGIRKGFFTRLLEFLIGGEDFRLVRPMAVAVTRDGLLYVADPGARGVHRFDIARGRHDLIRLDEEAPLMSPVGLAVGANGDVLVTDSYLDGVYTITPKAKFAVPLALKEALGQPTGIAYDADKAWLYVVDTAAHHVKVFDKDGAPIQTIGRRGIEQGEFNFPTMLWRDTNGVLYVTDSLNFRVQAFDAEGRFLGMFGRHGDGTGDHARPKGVATDRFGHIYVVDALFHAVQIFDRQGGFLLNVGSQGRDVGEFWLPSGVFVAPDDRIYVADSHNQRVQVFRYVGSEP